MPANKKQNTDYKYDRLNEIALPKFETPNAKGFTERTLETVAYVSQSTHLKTGEVKTSNKVQLILTTKKWSDEFKQYFDVPLRLILTEEEFEHIQTLALVDGKPTTTK